jgi:hypothetical protein
VSIGCKRWRLLTKICKDDSEAQARTKAVRRSTYCIRALQQVLLDGAKGRSKKRILWVPFGNCRRQSLCSSLASASCQWRGAGRSSGRGRCRLGAGESELSLIQSTFFQFSIVTVSLLFPNVDHARPLRPSRIIDYAPVTPPSRV